MLNSIRVVDKKRKDDKIYHDRLVQIRDNITENT
jgi:chromosomal replication initiator protein